MLTGQFYFEKIVEILDGEDGESTNYFTTQDGEVTKKFMINKIFPDDINVLVDSKSVPATLLSET